ncbi:MAG: hypothetical protein M0Z42_06785 [Actinomycetota bacterium]|nr:hypothetical protein [Actinomycetota bacterium]
MHIDAILNQGGFSNWRTDAGDLDVMTEMRDHTGTRRRYEDFAGDAQWLEFAGITVRVAGLKDIIASKEFADRPKDREALPELRALADRSGSIEPAQPAAPLPPPSLGPVLRPPGLRP